jgi:hypothetical protein
MTDQGGFFSKFKRGEFASAAELLKEKSQKPGKDQILFLLDRGTALFEAGLYEEAIEVLSQAERLTEIKDLTSISEEVVSVVTTDQYKNYYPLDYELIMINVYLALSYYATGNYEGALVECRRIDNLIYKLKNKGMKTFEELPFAWYLSALIYESQKKYNDALIDYRRVMMLVPDFKQAVFDSYRMARFIGKMTTARELEDKYPDLGLRNYYKSLCRKCGELIVIYADGEIPIKRPQRGNSMLPEFYTRTYSLYPLSVYSGDDKKLTVSSEILDLETVARKNLDERIGRIVAKRILGIGAKVAIGYGVAKATDNEALGILTGLLLQSTTHADTRSWSTLPKSISVARLRLPEGETTLDLRTVRDSKKTIKLKDGTSQVLWFRSF